MMASGLGVEEMSRDVLLITAMSGGEHCAASMGAQLGCLVELAASRRAGLQALRRRSYGAVIVEENLAEGDSAWADQVWAAAGLAMPLQVNFGISGTARLVREVRTALTRRDGEQALARRVITSELENELKGNVTGLLLQTELALREPAGSKGLEPKLRSLRELAGELQERLRGTAS